MAETLGFEFPYCYDESQAVARSYGAACTPDFFLFDGAGKLAYRGQLDDSRPGNDALLDGKDLRAALDAVLAGSRCRRSSDRAWAATSSGERERLSQARPAAEAASKPWGAPGRERE